MRLSPIVLAAIVLLSAVFAQTVSVTNVVTTSAKYSCNNIDALKERISVLYKEYEDMLKKCTDITAETTDCESRLASLKREIKTLEAMLLDLRAKCVKQKEKEQGEKEAEEASAPTKVEKPEINCAKMPLIERDYEKTQKTYLGLKKLCEMKAEKGEQSLDECINEIKDKLMEYRKTLEEFSKMLEKMKQVCLVSQVSSTKEAEYPYCERLKRDIKFIAEKLKEAKEKADETAENELKKKYSKLRDEFIAKCEKEKIKPKNVEEEIAKCIRRKLASDEKISYDEAKRLCMMPFKKTMPIISVCDRLKREIEALKEKLEVATDEDRPGIEKEIELLRKRLEKCLEKKEKPKTDACEELKSLKVKYEGLKEYYKELLEKCASDEKTACDERIKKVKEKIAELRKTMEEKERACKKTMEEKLKKPDFCMRAKNLKEILKALKERISETEKKVKSGEMPEEELKEQYKKLYAVEEELKKAREFCEKKVKPIKPEMHPCRWLEETKLLYEKLIKEYENSPSDELAEKIKDVKERIKFLKEKCEAEVKTPKRLSEITAYIDEKKSEAIETAIEQGLSPEEMLKKLEEQKKRLIEEFTKRMKELEIKIYEVKKRIRFMKGKMEIDDVPLPSKPVKVEVVKGEEKEDVEVNPEKDRIIIRHKGKEVDAETELEYRDGMLYSTKSNKPINVLPGELSAVGKIKRLRIFDKGDKPVYRAEEERDGRLFGFIPVKLSVKREIDAVNGGTLKEEKPWWSFLVAESNPQPSPKPELPKERVAESNPQPSP